MTANDSWCAKTARFRKVQRQLSTAFCIAVAALQIAPVEPAHANFYDSWPGNVAIYYQGPGQAPVPQSSPIPPIQQLVAGIWAGAAGRLCSVVLSALPAGSSLYSCSISPNGDLQAEMVTGQQFDLRWIVRGNTAFVGYPSPTVPVDLPVFGNVANVPVCGESTVGVDVQFDVQADLIVDVASTIDGTANATTTPLTLSSAIGEPQNAQLSSRAECAQVDPGILRDKAATINALTFDLREIPAVGGELGPAVANLNALLHAEANKIMLPPNSNRLFNFGVNITPTTLDVTYARDGNPPQRAPTGCIFEPSGSYWGDSTAFTGTCDANQDPSITALQIHDQVFNIWSLPKDDVTPTGWTAMNAAGQPVMMIQLPSTNDPGLQGGPTESLMVCAVSDWAAQPLCSPPYTFEYTGYNQGGGIPSSAGSGGETCIYGVTEGVCNGPWVPPPHRIPTHPLCPGPDCVSRTER